MLQFWHLSDSSFTVQLGRNKNDWHCALSPMARYHVVRYGKGVNAWVYYARSTGRENLFDFIRMCHTCIEHFPFFCIAHPLEEGLGTCLGEFNMATVFCKKPRMSMMLCAVAIEVEVPTPPPALRRNGTQVYTSTSSSLPKRRGVLLLFGQSSYPMDFKLCLLLRVTKLIWSFIVRIWRTHICTFWSLTNAHAWQRGVVPHHDITTTRSGSWYHGKIQFSTVRYLLMFAIFPVLYCITLNRTVREYWTRYKLP